jgi:hypothetical protein
VDGMTYIIGGVIGLVIVFALTERWRLVWQAKRKRERQNRAHQDDDRT